MIIGAVITKKENSIIVVDRLQSSTFICRYLHWQKFWDFLDNFGWVKDSWGEEIKKWNEATDEQKKAIGIEVQMSERLSECPVRAKPGPKVPKIPENATPPSNVPAHAPVVPPSYNLPPIGTVVGTQLPESLNGGECPRAKRPFEAYLGPPLPPRKQHKGAERPSLPSLKQASLHPSAFRLPR
ncbi:hypothetical protein BDP27DRAFT_1318973 [Rhodocollybia butyracea]|uniref:Uncharacterized protein n=1 Tax=Rhodocollybia butyracea TaxID=206335 RepID=A0A9P5Q3Y7_9AGAR|nr:hypothetical protein BDP27DRAFT_1318973 [Rhodocollybia butyracea]